MIQVISKMKVKSDENTNFVNLFKKMVEPTNNEKGCHQYELCNDMDNVNLFFVLEKWETIEDFNNHIESSHGKEFIPQILDCLEVEVESSISKMV